MATPLPDLKVPMFKVQEKNVVAPAGTCLCRPQSKRPGKEADIRRKSGADTSPPDRGTKAGAALTTTVGLDMSCLTSHTLALCQQTSDIPGWGRKLLSL